ncbi:MAG: hypothetical protein K2H53_05640 [Clostridia bacterium]|nr:hypothetical protein [Clostridia bacterium]
MKKVLMGLIFIVGIFIFSSEVNASNKLYFTKSGNRLYYDSGKIDDGAFINHQDMIPGKTFTDELIIENGTKTDYTLYFKIRERNQSEELNEFLDHIEMKIYLDGKLLYEGLVKGLDYTEEGISLQQALNLGEYKPHEEHKMVVETTLELEYSDTTERAGSWIDWQFYAVYEDEIIPIDKNPNTLDGIKTIFIMYIISLIAIIMIIVLLRCSAVW